MNQKDCICIIILNQNKKDDLLDCINSINQQVYKNFIIVVVDNGSVDGSAEAVKNKYPEVNLIENKINSGAAGGRNIGIKYAIKNLHFNFFLFLDNDVILEKYFLQEMIKSVNVDPNLNIITPKCYLMDYPGIIGYAGGMSINLFTGDIENIGNEKRDEGQFDQSKFVSSSGGLCLISRKVINEVGLFDERFNPYGWEDVDYSLRAREKGFKIFYNHNAIIYHKGGKKQRGKIAEVYESSKVKNYFYLIRKHANIFQLLLISFILPFKLLFLIIKEIFHGEFRILYFQFRGLLSLLKK
jgi:GT2 family glycosyltransferase